VRRIAAQEWARRRALKPAVKATKAKLHQVWGAYEAPVDYARELDALRAAYAGEGVEGVRSACRRLLGLHASTRERLPILEGFYTRIYARTGKPRALLDLACGLNPLSVPWMDLPSGTSYHAYDIDGERTVFLGRVIELMGFSGGARLQDVLVDPPTGGADVALLLKSVPCLEQQQRGGTLALLDALDVAHVVVSYPVHTLGRRRVGMPEHYARAFDDMLAARSWGVARLDFRSELVYVVDKR
jgi:16S rRNA (guanine(1405)-N(7))-methyltransferase